MLADKSCDFLNVQANRGDCENLLSTLGIFYLYPFMSRRVSRYSSCSHISLANKMELLKKMTEIAAAENMTMGSYGKACQKCKRLLPETFSSIQEFNAFVDQLAEWLDNIAPVLNPFDVETIILDELLSGWKPVFPKGETLNGLPAFLYVGPALHSKLGLYYDSNDLVDCLPGTFKSIEEAMEISLRASEYLGNESGIVADWAPSFHDNGIVSFLDFMEDEGYKDIRQWRRLLSVAPSIYNADFSMSFLFKKAFPIQDLKLDAYLSEAIFVNAGCFDDQTGKMAFLCYFLAYCDKKENENIVNRFLDMFNELECGIHFQHFPLEIGPGIVGVKNFTLLTMKKKEEQELLSESALVFSAISNPNTIWTDWRFFQVSNILKPKAEMDECQKYQSCLLYISFIMKHSDYLSKNNRDEDMLDLIREQRAHIFFTKELNAFLYDFYSRVDKDDKESYDGVFSNLCNEEMVDFDAFLFVTYMFALKQHTVKVPMDLLRYRLKDMLLPKARIVGDESFENGLRQRGWVPPDSYDELYKL